MGDTNRHCPDCGAPLATEADDGDNAGCEPGCECSVCASLCWRAWYGNRCQRYPHDWQAEAMALRERLAAIVEALEKEVGESHLCDEWDHGYLRGIGRAIDIVKGAPRG